MAPAENYQVPERDGEVVVVPSPETLPEVVRANAARCAGYAFPVSGVPAADLARQVRSDVFRRAGAPAGRPVVATGHQPELFHPGIWIKNHLAGRLAQAVGGAGLNFVVDNDAVHLDVLRVPAVGPGGLGMRTIPFIPCPTDVAAEDLRVPAGAPDVLAEAARLADASLGDTLAGAFAASARPAEAVSEFLSAPRRSIEESFGLRNAELTVGDLAETHGFRLFCEHLVAHAERFAAAYNGALGRFRAERGLRNPVEPTPDLRRKGERLEAPFWIWRPGQRRQPMTATAEDVADPAAALRRLRDDGFKVRPRALAMTMFFRLFCCDLFIHGMGGARYEPVNDAIIREFFAADPPAWAAASATLLLRPAQPLPAPVDTAELRRRLRRMHSTPERFVDEFLANDPEAQELARRRAALRHPAGSTKRRRRRAYKEGHEVAARLRERLAPHILAAGRELERAEKQAAVRAAVRSREHPFFLYPRAALQELCALPALT